MLNTTIFIFFPSKSRTKGTYQPAKAPDGAGLDYTKQLSSNGLYRADKLNTNNPTAAWTQRSAKDPGPQGRSHMLYLSTGSPLHRISGPAGGDPEPCTATHPPWHALPSWAHPASAQLPSHQTTSTAKKPSQNKPLSTAPATPSGFPGEHQPLPPSRTKQRQKSHFFPQSSTLQQPVISASVSAPKKLNPNTASNCSLSRLGGFSAQNET